MKTKGSLATVFLAVLIDLMGFGLVLPLLPFYASTFHASAVAIGLLYSVYSLAQLVFSPLWGSLSDRVGRRPIMLMSTLGAVCAYLLFAVSQSLTVLFTSRLIAGIMGGNISTAQAYAADVTAPEDRAKGMGLIGAAFGIGFVLGPALSTLLIHPSFVRHLPFHVQNPYSLPGFFAAFMSLASFFLVLFKLPETVARQGQKKKPFVLKGGVFSKSFWTSIFEVRQSKARYLFPLLILSAFLLSFGQSSLYSAFPLFCKARLAMPAEQVGMQFVIMGLIAVLIQGGLIRHLVKKWGEEKLFFTGSILMICGLALIPFAPSQKIVTLFLSVMAVGASLNGPTLNSLISKEADPSQIGRAMGTSQGISGLGRVLGPTWGGWLYGLYYSGPFLATAAAVSGTLWIGHKLKQWAKPM